ncbi:hypothetical protein [Pseudomonas citronellolis]|uniref:hypothetical protein n=1 Tax=Pseudomonas citronellolis TaxID=53408 RepID=UPI00209F2E21|nr:hypothetical protein [Pseudomonas citronellolis]MCP1603711.1 hypothetical protein [Pseudomonas citronellolis]MCP1653222.1 hypothetical protein [Pseudomonas citronellolis]MCP1720458.1 hypothetical protein [Pseudomonas citronellolis]
MASKYTLLSEKSVRAAVQDGVFTSKTVDIVRDANNSFVRHLERQDTPTIPSSVVQIHNNYIYEADTSKYLSAVIDIQNKYITGELKIKYDEVIVGLTAYQEQDSDLELLNTDARKSLSAFGERSSQILSPQSNEPYLKDASLEVLDSYTNLIFVYVMSGFWRFRSGFSKDSVATNKLDTLDSEVRSLYSWLLQNGKDHENQIGKSVYAYILLEKPEEIEVISQLVEYDNRYNSALDVVKSFSLKCIDRKGWSEPYKVSRLPNDTWGEDRLRVALKLHDILNKISNIRSVIDELKAVGEIKVSDILLDGEYLDSPLSLFRIKNNPDV